MPILFLLFVELTGLWHAKFTAPDGAKRELHLALKVEGSAASGVVETPTRRAALVEGRLAGGGFAAIAESDWDGRLARRPVEAQLKGDELHLRIQAWPDGPMAEYTMRRIGDDPAIPRPRPLPLPPLRDLPYNGLAPTSPMGWSSWNKFGCRIDDKVIREMADAMVSSGMKAAGYTYVNLDDCWQGERNGNGDIQSDPARFPDMKALADYVHSKGLKIGIYSSPGPRTCAGYEGSYGHEEQDARVYAAWGFDYLKYDWCSAGKLYKPEEQRAVFQRMGVALQATGRPIVYSISQYGAADVWTWAAKTGANLWRTTGDIGDNWKAVAEIGFDRQLKLAPFAGPGRWNDPDMLEVGNGGMTAEEYRSHLSLWALLAAPLLAGNDVRAMTAETAALLMNRDVIEVNQDPLGRQGSRVWKELDVEAWTKPLKDGSLAVGIFNRSDAPRKLSVGWKDIGLRTAPTMIRDLWRRIHPKPLPFGHPVNLPGHGVTLLRVK